MGVFVLILVCFQGLSYANIGCSILQFHSTHPKYHDLVWNRNLYALAPSMTIPQRSGPKSHVLSTGKLACLLP
jgi:hypothetical protein